MTIAALPGHADRRILRRAVAALTVTQVIGWSTTFHLPAVLSERIGAGIGMRAGFVFGGITIMLIVAAALAPWAGRVLERHGTRRPMVAGSLLMTAGLATMAAVPNPTGFVVAWMVLGAAMPFALNQASSTALVQIAPGEARRAIALLLLLSGVSAMVAWPALVWLDGAIGWRGTVTVCALLNLALCAPLHRLGLPRGRVVADPRPPARPTASAVRARQREGPPLPASFGLAALAFSLSGMLTWGLPLHIVNLLRDFGHTEAAAVTIGALFAPGQVASRALEMVGGHRFGILTVGVAASVLMPLAFVALLLWGTGPAGAMAFSFGYGIAAGLTSIVRAVAPLRLFGAAAYATVLGRLNVPQNIAFATAPLGFAAVREAWGGPALVWLCLALAVPSLAAMWRLERLAAASDRATRARP